MYDSISPVNTFRLIFNHYFDAGFPLLDDLSYYSAMSSPYNYVPIAEDRPGCENESRIPNPGGLIHPMLKSLNAC